MESKNDIVGEKGSRMNKITCISLGVRDMGRSVAFYRDELGFKTDCMEDSPQNYGTVPKI